MPQMKRILVTGATGKVGQTFIQRLLADPQYEACTVRALCHHRGLASNERLEIVRGSVADLATVQTAVRDVSHVLHLATCKETPSEIMDVAVKGLFWLLEACRASAAFRQFVLIGGDASVGHFHFPHAAPVTEQQRHTAYPGCYALSKVLEEVMLEQYYVQHDFNGCCLRAPWVMEKDDLRYHLSFGEDVFGGPRWRDLVGRERADDYARIGAIPVMLDTTGQPLKRGFVHVDDLVEAIFLAFDHPRARQETFNISMDEPVDYGELGHYLQTTRGFPLIPVPTSYHSTWLDNAKAKFLLGWRPQVDLRGLVERAWGYERPESDPRIIWYPG